MNDSSLSQKFEDALWRIYHRPERPDAWTAGGNLPWHEPAFSKRMLAEHLDETHSAASRTQPGRAAQIDWLWTKLDLAPEAHLLDVTCGPGLYATTFAQRGCTVHGIDFGPAAIEYAQELAQRMDVHERCKFVEQDIRQMELPDQTFDAAILLYGQLAVFPRDQAKQILGKIARSLKVGAKLCIELLDPIHVDKTDSTWWFTDTCGLWGDAPFLNLGERFWNQEERCSTERYTILHLETGVHEIIHLSDQTYTPDELTTNLLQVGYSEAKLYPHWDQLPLYDAQEWNIFIATK